MARALDLNRLFAQMVRAPGQSLLFTKMTKALGPRRTPTIFQHEAAECGVACLAMVLAYHGRWVPLEELREVAGVNRDGSKASNLIKTAKRYGLDGAGYSVDPQDIGKSELPVIVFWNFNHFVVVERHEGDRVWINDPATGPRE